MADAKLNDASKAVGTQINELREQISSLSKSLASLTDNFSDDASEYADIARRKVKRAAENVREHGHNVVEAVKENPGTAATAASALTVVGLLGFAIGYYLANASAQESNFSNWKNWR